MDTGIDEKCIFCKIINNQILSIKLFETQFKRKFIDPKDFLAYTLWGRPGGKMIEDALKIKI